ncbi:M3 family oligoendopeptidase [Paenibacillus sp. JX-17]|uniref:M3 family oligoendopeptidase n=1 Tax=Paenibacillus lacisoli TaxID=3064525 RepID=A0ABT9CGN2_9BACL|nr:M3 family oligoendopeptidase [Paenibacillus sp. JX-17]MDO7907092.1 M3 family oligoendopeptidase [Paenibacillus sp. JX-17]
MKKPLQQTWDLESIFPGGSSSEAFTAFLDQLEQDLRQLLAQVKAAQPPQNVKETESYDSIYDLLQSTMTRASQAGAFVSCLTAQNQHDKKAVQLSGRISSIYALLKSADALLDNLLRLTPDDVWSAWLERSNIRPIAFVLNESREKAQDKMSPEMEGLALDLAVDGYHGWSEFYDTIVSHVTVAVEENGEVKQLSAGQAANKLDDPDREVRKAVFAEWEKSWGKAGEYASDVLNHLGGFRLKLYENRGWEDVLKEPLSINRMSRQTLDTMWQVISDAKPMLVKYLQRKAELLGVDKLAWYDVEAPISKSVSKVTYDEAAEKIVDQFRTFSPRMADFAVTAFEKNWIEAEDRDGKRPGGFCTSLPLTKETRIFMTYAGTASNVSTLAHELGHGYHQHVMDELEPMNQGYAMNVAETASTFAEMIVSDALVRTAKDEQEKLALLEDKIQRSVAFFMNIHARFLFETRFYEQRKKGLVGADQLNELMVAAQKEAYLDALSEYHPHFWASKLHFYITGVPFYNYPYTFGYMFSAGIYAFAQNNGSGFAAKYDALLQDTGRMTVEELAQKHLGTDLTQRDFWQMAVDLVASDIEEFLELTSKS